MADKSSWTPGEWAYYAYLIGCDYSEEYAAEQARSGKNNSKWEKMGAKLQAEGFGVNSGKARPWVPEKFDPKKVADATRQIAGTPK